MSDNELLSPEEFSIPKNRIDLISSIIWIAIGAFIIYGTRDLSYTDEFGFGPKFFPLWLGILLVLLGIALGVQSLSVSKETQHINIAGKVNAIRMLLIIISFFGFVFIVEKAGFFLSAALLFFFLLLAVEKKGWKFSLIAAVLCYIGLWFLFDLTLDVNLPLGVMEFIH